MIPTKQKSGLSGPTTVGHSGLRRFVSRFDWPLFCVVVLITFIGMLNLYSATDGTAHEIKFAKQLRFMVLGLCVYLGVSFLDYRHLQRVAWIVLGGCILLAVAVFVLGKTSKGAQRWIGYGPVRLQPSELLKIGVILAMARMVQMRDAAAMSLKELAPRIFAIGAPVLLIAVQPDLGSASLILLIILSVAFLVVRTLWPLVVSTLVGLAMIPVLWETMHTYQKNRILCFLDPYDDPTGTCWHTLQSIFAVGSGRVTGKGFMESTQKSLNFLPEHWTDFPFSVFAEEWGFIGSVFVLAVFAFLIFWMVNLALDTRDKFGSIICLGVAAMIFWHVVVNVAMVLGVAPVVGVTLPLISYGGSSMVTFFIALGLVSSVSMRRRGY